MGLNIFLGIVIIAALYAAYQYYFSVFLPRLKKNHIKQLTVMIEEWLSHIDKNFNKGMNKQFLNELEGKILRFIDGTELKNMKLIFSSNFRSKFLASRKVEKELWLSDNIFRKQTGIDVKPIGLNDYWLILRRSFYQFYWNYTGEGVEEYFDSLESKVKLLKMYFDLEDSPAGKAPPNV